MAAAGWYPDPTGRFELRYFDGNSWSSSVSRAGQQFADPMVSGPPIATTGPWPAAGYGGPAAPFPPMAAAGSGGNGLAVTALVLGILGALVGLIPFFFVGAFLLGLLAIVFGAIGAGRREGQGRSTMAVSGLVLGIVAIGLGGLGLYLTNKWVDNVEEGFEEVFSTLTTQDRPPDSTFVAEAPADSRSVVWVGTPLPPFEPMAADPAIGLPAPVLTGSDFAGNPLGVDAANDGPYLVAFVAHWCPHCNAEIPRLLEWKASGAMPAGLQVMGVSTAVSPSSPNYPPSDWLDGLGWDWPVLADESTGDGTAGVAAEAFGATGWPYLVVIGSDGLVKARATGEMEIADLQAFVDEALAGEAFPTN